MDEISDHMNLTVQSYCYDCPSDKDKLFGISDPVGKDTIEFALSLPAL